jgi:hypothetical protein
MADKVLHILYPVEATTEFLNEIVTYLIEKFGKSIIVHRLDSSDDYRNFKKNAQNLVPINGDLLFLGHGSSKSLSGDLESGAYISEEELGIFQYRRVVLLSCRSSEYLHNYGRESGILGGIGFPNLITEFEEIQQHANPEKFTGINAADIERFKAILVDATKYSIEEYLKSDMTFYKLFKRIQIRVRRALVQYYSSKVVTDSFGNMLQELEHGLSLVGD